MNGKDAFARFGDFIDGDYWWVPFAALLALMVFIVVMGARNNYDMKSHRQRLMAQCLDAGEQEYRCYALIYHGRR